MIALALACSLAAVAQPEVDRKYFKFYKGTQWTYDVTYPSGTGTWRSQVTASSGDRVEIRHFHTLAKSGLSKTKETWTWDKSYFAVSFTDDKGKPASARLYKMKSRKGDTWAGMIKNGEEGNKTTHMGFETVKVPAGEYKNVLHVQMEALFGNMKGIEDYYFAPEAGLIQYTITLSDKRTITLKLRSLKKS